MIVGQFDKEDVRRGGEFHVDAVNERTRIEAGVMVYSDRGDGIIEVGFTSEFKGRELQRALADAADALRFRADSIAVVAPPMAEYQSLISAMRQHAEVIETHAQEIAE